jgi:cob(I)alamin adenosyltransferase
MVEQKEGIVQIYWGDGKGKTTAALGQALRALGHGYKVHLVQFLKSNRGHFGVENSGELLALKGFQNFSFRRFGAVEWANLRAEKAQRERQSASAQEAYEYILTCLSSGYDLIIADEILYAVQMALLDEEKVALLIKAKPKHLDLILTGANKQFPRIFELADLVTEFRKVRHHYDSGIPARKGIEY